MPKEEKKASAPSAPEAEEDHGVDEGVKTVKGKHSDGAADLEKVTDFVEEQEISAQDIQKTMKMVLDRRLEEANKRAAREKEISKVKVSQSDVDLIVCGSMPYDDSNDDQRPNGETVGFSHSRNVNESAKHLIHAILQADVSRRFKITDIRSHTWLTSSPI